MNVESSQAAPAAVAAETLERVHRAAANPGMCKTSIPIEWFARAERDPVEEAERLETLARLGLLTDEPNTAFDAITDVFRIVLNVPVSFILLVGEHRAFAIAKSGSDLTSMQRCHAFCDVVVDTRVPLIVRDATRDPRFAENPYVTGPMNVRFYVGIPMRTSSGVVIGALCGIDNRVREAPRPELIDTLERLATSAMATIELRASERDLKANEQDLRRESAILQATLDAIDEGVTAFDRDLKLISWNEQAISLADMPPGTFVHGRDFSSFALTRAKQGYYGPGDPAELAAARSAIVSSAKRSVSDVVLADGRTVEVRVVPLQGGGSVAAHRDVTAERARQDELKHEARRFEAQARIASIANKATNLGDALHRTVKFLCEVMRYDIAHVYRVVEPLNGPVSTGIFYVRGRAPGARPLAELANPSIVSATTLRTLAAQGPTYIDDPDLRHLGAVADGLSIKGGHAFSVPILSDTYIFEFFGDRVMVPRAWHTLVRDHIANQLTRVAQRERMDRLTSEFVSTVNHELRTPLTAILGMLELLDAGVFGSFSDEVSEVIGMAYQNSRRLTRIVDDILDVEAIATSPLPQHREASKLEPLVRAAIAGITTSFPDRRIEVVTADGDDGLTALTHGNHVVDVLNRLLSNALKFSPTDTTVIITISRHGSRIRLSVTDQGQGIPLAFQAHVFERFARADGTDTRTTEGTGLGLAIAKELVGKIGGELSFETALGFGTSFHLDLLPAPVAMTSSVGKD